MKLVLLFCLLFGCLAAEYQGVWWWTWTGGLTGLDPSKTNIAIAFSGWTDASQAISDSNKLKNQLPGLKFISLGGGNANGHWGVADVGKTEQACRSGQFAGYDGIAFDIEEGDSGLDFRSCFAACKQAGYQVMVTVSHSAPYGVDDAQRLMDSFFSDSNIDFLSPQMYTTGTEGGNDFAITKNVAWQKYASSKAKIVPAIVTGSMYADCEAQFRNFGVKIVGYVQWAQAMTYPSGGGAVPLSAPTTGGGGGGVQCNGATCNPGDCCSKYGYCGTTPDHCGEGCKGGPCIGGGGNPPPPPPPPPQGGGACNGACQPNECCSKYGYCGTTADHCGEGCKGGPCQSGSSPQVCQNVGRPCDPGECCSEYGWCGKGPEFCKGQRVEGEGDQQSSPSGGLSTGALVGIIVGSVVAAILVVGIVVVVFMKRSNSHHESV